MEKHEAIMELEQLFTVFRKETPSGRNSLFPQLEFLCFNIGSQFGGSYETEQCTSIIESCKKMKSLRPPKEYNDSNEISFVLGYISIIKDGI